MPILNNLSGAFGASIPSAEDGPPDKMTPWGEKVSSLLAAEENGVISQ